MAFLTSTDYKSQITDGILARVIEDDNTLVTTEELVAVETVKSYLRNRFDVDEMFAQTGDDRNPLLIMHLVNIVLFNLFTRVVPKNIPEVRSLRYQATIEWLMAVSKGELIPDFTVIQITDPETGDLVDETFFLVNSRKKYSEPW